MAGAVIRLLEPSEAERLTKLMVAVYGSSYEVPWVYDPHEIRRRMAGGLLLCAVAELDGAIACHCALSFHHPDDQVGHTGQAVTLPAARGHHLFTSVKRFLVERGRHRGMVGMYSEATAAHPYSQRANLELGANETGYLLGYIAGAVDNSITGAGDRRQSAALFYLRVRRGTDRPLYAPPDHREMVRAVVAGSGMPGRMADPPRHHRTAARSASHTVVEAPANRAVVTVSEPAEDLGAVARATRDRLFGRGYDAVYLDLPLDHPSTATAGEAASAAGLSFAGVFPEVRGRTDMLRLQAVRSGVVTPGDITVASEHGRQLLDYVLRDLERTGHRMA